MLKFQSILLCIAIVIGSNLATIPYDDVQLNIFDDRPRDFEFGVIESTRIVKSFFDRFDVSLAIAGGMAALNSTPYIGNFSKLVPLIRNSLASKSEWRAIFTEAVKDETMFAVTESELKWMKSTVKTMQTKMKLLSNNNPDIENRKTVASIIHTDLNKMINLFERKSSLYRKHPLLGAAPLIHVATLVATFCPIAKVLIPLEAKNPQISCKMYDVLLDYLPRAIITRLQKLDAEEPIFQSIVEVMSLPFTPNGYNKTNPGTIDCIKGCEDRKLYSQLCLTDDYSSDEYFVSDKYTSTCVTDYVGLIRHRIEDLFPIDQLDKLCVNRTEQIPTGYGWLSIFFLRAYTYGEINGKTCKLNPSLGCDPFVILYVNDKEVLKTPKETDKFVTNVNRTFTSVKIPKNSSIRLEIWDAKSGFFEKKDELILRSEGDIDSFLNEPIRKGVYVLGDLNRIETMSFWIDEYKFKNVPRKIERNKLGL